MARRSRNETQRILRSVVVLMRNTTWKCGKIERLIIEHLQSHLRRYGTTHLPVKDMVQRFNLDKKQKSEFFDALKRLERRHIVEIKTL